MSFRLNIGIVCYPTYGGSGVVATELARYLARIGHNIHVISYDFPVRMPAYDPNITFHAVSPKDYALFRDVPYTISLAAKCAEVAEESELDILHVHYAIPHAVSGYLARAMVRDKRPLKLVTTLHGTDITLVGSDPSYFSMVKFAIEESDAVTAVSQHLAEETIARFGITRTIEVVYNFINPNDFKQTSEGKRLKRLFAPDGERLICYVSNFRPVKRACDAVEIYAHLNCAENVKLLMVGDGIDMPHVHAKVKELDLESSILFLGNRGDVHRILEVCDVLVMPSESESFGLAALEAMAAGCAIVCTTVGGLPEVVTQQCGFLHEVGDVEGMAESVCRLLNEPHLLGEMQENARKRAVTEFDIRAKVAQYINCYKRLVGKSEQFGPEYRTARHLSD